MAQSLAWSSGQRSLLAYQTQKYVVVIDCETFEMIFNKLVDGPAAHVRLSWSPQDVLMGASAQGLWHYDGALTEVPMADVRAAVWSPDGGQYAVLTGAQLAIYAYPSKLPVSSIPISDESQTGGATLLWGEHVVLVSDCVYRFDNTLRLMFKTTPLSKMVLAHQSRAAILLGDSKVLCVDSPKLKLMGKSRCERLILYRLYMPICDIHDLGDDTYAVVTNVVIIVRGGLYVRTALLPFTPACSAYRRPTLFIADGTKIERLDLV